MTESLSYVAVVAGLVVGSVLLSLAATVSLAAELLRGRRS